MYDNLARRAILTALANDWESALEANLKILSETPDDANALNRAARAHLQLGDLENAITLSQKVLTIDPLNKIAIKCIAKCEALASNGHHPISNHEFSDSLFLEVPGKTKIVSLINLCESVILARLSTGSNVQMVPRMHKVAITTVDEVYIGRLPDDLATRIIHLVKCGNEYCSYIKSVSDADVKIFIEETKKGDAASNMSSFPVRRQSI